MPDPQRKMEFVSRVESKWYGSSYNKREQEIWEKALAITARLDFLHTAKQLEGIEHDLNDDCDCDVCAQVAAIRRSVTSTEPDVPAGEAPPGQDLLGGPRD